MTTPTGDPPWVRSADHTVYGGHVGKHDYEQQGVTNPLTDISAAQFMRLVNDAAAVAATAPFAVLRVTCNDSGTPAAPTVNWVRAMNGIRATSYAGDAEPSGMPEATRVDDGEFTLQWPATLTDSYGVSAAPAIIAAFAYSSGYTTTITLTDARTFSVAVLDGASAVADAVVDLVVY